MNFGLIWYTKCTCIHFQHSLLVLFTVLSFSSKIKELRCISTKNNKVTCKPVIHKEITPRKEKKFQKRNILQLTTLVNLKNVVIIGITSCDQKIKYPNVINFFFFFFFFFYPFFTITSSSGWARVANPPSDC